MHVTADHSRTPYSCSLALARNGSLWSVPAWCLYMCRSSNISIAPMFLSGAVLSESLLHGVCALNCGPSQHIRPPWSCFWVLSCFSSCWLSRWMSNYAVVEGTHLFRAFHKTNIYRTWWVYPSPQQTIYFHWSGIAFIRPFYYYYYYLSLTWRPPLRSTFQGACGDLSLFLVFCLCPWDYVCRWSCLPTNAHPKLGFLHHWNLALCMDSI